MNQTCRKEEEFLSDPINLGAIIFHFASSIMAICVIAYTYTKFRSNFPYHWKREHLLYYSMLITLVLAITFALNYGILLLKLIFVNNPCEISTQVGECRGLRWTFLMLMCLILLPYFSLINQGHMPINASTVPKTPNFSSQTIYMVLFFLITVSLVIRFEDSQQSVPHCLVFSTANTGANHMLGALACFELLAMIALFYLVRVNEDLTREWTYDEIMKLASENPRSCLGYSEGRKRKEVAEVLRRLWPIIGTSALVKIFYLVSSLMIKQMDLTTNPYFADMISFLVLPHLPVLIGLLTLRMLRLHFHDREKERALIKNRHERDSVQEMQEMAVRALTRSVCSTQERQS